MNPTIISAVTATTTAARMASKSMNESENLNQPASKETILSAILIWLAVAILIFSMQMVPNWKATADRLDDNSILNEWCGYQTLIDANGDGVFIGR